MTCEGLMKDNSWPWLSYSFRDNRTFHDNLQRAIIKQVGCQLSFHQWLNVSVAPYCKTKQDFNNYFQTTNAINQLSRLNHLLGFWFQLSTRRCSKPLSVMSLKYSSESSIFVTTEQLFEVLGEKADEKFRYRMIRKI